VTAPINGRRPTKETTRLETQPPSPAQRRGSRRLLVVTVIGAVVSLLGGGAYFWLSAHDVTGLEGTWHDTANPSHSCEFRRNGDVATWSGSKSWWNKIGWDATWRRSGQKITIRTDRNWDFVGELDGDVIRGKMLMKNERGVVEQEIDATLQRE